MERAISAFLAAGKYPSCTRAFLYKQDQRGGEDEGIYQPTSLFKPDKG